jgi:hypothetical protein
MRLRLRRRYRVRWCRRVSQNARRPASSTHPLGADQGCSRPRANGGRLRRITRTELPICARPRCTERAHRMSPEEPRQALPIGTSGAPLIRRLRYRPPPRPGEFPALVVSSRSSPPVRRSPLVSTIAIMCECLRAECTRRLSLGGEVGRALLCVPYWLAMAICQRSSGVMRWSWSFASSPRSIWIHSMRPLNTGSPGPLAQVYARCRSG